MPLQPSSSHSERKNRIHLHASSRNSKQQEWDRELVALIIKLLGENDHDSLALISRNAGIPPQLRHAVWPILLKYHPMVISPNILSNTLVLKDDENETELQYFPEDRTDDEISDLMDNELNKYFQVRHSVPVPPEIQHIKSRLKDCVWQFLKKWGKICKYESGLIWIALGLAEWCPMSTGDDLVLSGKKHHNHNSALFHLYNEYPMLDHLVQKLPVPEFSFDAVYERLVMVLFHSPVLDEKPDNSTYYLFKSGNLNQQSQLFFKIFAKTLPELYQPITDEGALQGSKKITWLYWWIKCCGCKVLHRQDRARIWDVLLGWRPRPESINYYLDYNRKSFESIYTKELRLPEDVFHRICKGEHDEFWFPDLMSLKLGKNGLNTDKDVIRELIRRNKYGEEPEPHENEIPYSLLNPRTQLLFIYVAIIQHNEFKLLEFEETEITEFLNNVPLISKFDDYNFKKMYDDDITSGSSTDTDESIISLTRPSLNHMMIEVGTDDKIANSFDEIYQQAGDIWRNWAWQEMEEFVED